MSRQNVIDTAAEENGTKENPANSNKTKYGQWYGFNGVPWCAIFVSWVYDKSGNPLGKIDTDKGYHYVPSAYVHWKATGEVTTNPQPADIVLYDWNGDGVCDHTGIFVKWIVPGSTFQAWEGNTSIGNNSDGGEVMLRNRNVASVRAFVSPKVLGAAVIPAAPTALQAGSKGADVVEMQKILHDLGYTIDVDGDFGPKTATVVMAFEKDNRLDITGIVTPQVFAAMQAVAAGLKIPNKKLTTGSYLQKGDSGFAVLVLQQALNSKGANPALVADGVFGTGTATAVKTFQSKNGLAVDGVAGPQTLNALGIAGSI